MKRHLLITVVFLGILAIAAQAQAALYIDPSIAFASGLQNDTKTIEEYIHNSYGVVLPPLYKSNVGGGEEGALAGSYSTTFSPATDPSGAHITYNGGPYVGPTAWLLVKDGNQNPAWYLFDLTSRGWNGMDMLDLYGFWPAQGAISFVGLYGTKVPEPETLLLLGSGLVGLAFVRRKFKA